MSSSAAVRAHFAKIAVRRLRALPDGKGVEIRDRLPDDLGKRVRRLSSDDWMPVSDMIALCDAIAAVLGEAGARSLWTELIRDTYDSGLLRPLMTEVRASTLDADAAASQLLRLAPQAWTLASRGCGSIKLDDRDGGLRLTSGDLLPALIRSRGIHCLFYGACQSMLDQFRVNAEIAVSVAEDNPEKIIFAIRRR